MNIRWVIQDNLIAEKDLANMHTVLDELNIEHEEVLVIPFSDELPKFTLDDKTNIYYGSTTFMNNIYRDLDKPVGLFYNHETFSMDNYLWYYGKNMLSDKGNITDMAEVIEKYADSEKQWFFRPDGDGKEFDGQVASGVEMVEMLKRVVHNDERMVAEDFLMLVAPPFNIAKEWRNYIVNGKVVTSTRYREYFRLSKSATDIPEDMLEFVNKMIKRYQPHEVFAMDIGFSGDEYYIIECGCMNSVGFYDADVREYIKGISEYVNELKIEKILK